MPIRTTQLALLLPLFSLFAVPVQDPPKQEAPSEMKNYMLVYFDAGKPTKKFTEQESAEMLESHLRNFSRLSKDGKLLLAGPIAGADPVRGIAIVDAKDEKEVRDLFASDKFLQNNVMILRMAKWMSAKLPVRPFEYPPDVAAHTFAFLRRGPNASAISPSQSAEIQKGHLAHLEKMWKAGELAVAGPLLSNNEDVRGILIFRSSDMEKVKKLIADDPAVKAGRLKMDVHQMYLPKGTLPLPPAS